MIFIKNIYADRIKELVFRLNKASEEYYKESNPSMSDKEYDRLYDELLELEVKSGITISSSPTQRVGEEAVEGLNKIKHDAPMLSLDKTKEQDKLLEFIEKPEDKSLAKGILSWKIDGLTIVLKYNNGQLINAITRGNGETGEDVTHNVKVFQNVPLTIPFKGELSLRGEAVIPWSAFKRINESSLENELQYKNPRNLTSGTVRQLNNKDTAKRSVMLYAFTVVLASGMDFDDSKENMLLWLKDMGFDIVEYKMVTPVNLIESLNYFADNVSNMDFASDGLVLTYDSISYSRQLGTTAKFPRDSMAFKWEDEIAETTIREIEWNTSRTGLINPVAVFDEVLLEGTTVSRASLHNAGIVEELQIGVGDRVTVYKANMIIPQIEKNLTKSKSNKEDVAIPTHCPVCGFKAELKKIKDQKALYCVNSNCYAVRVKFLTHFVSRNAMNIEGLSENTIKKFVDNKFLETFVDIYRLERHYDTIKDMEGFGERSVKKLDESIKASKKPELPNFINALGIYGIGLSSAKLLCNSFNFDLEAIINADTESLTEIDGFGNTMANAVYEYFANEKNRELIKEALNYIQIIRPDANSEDKPLTGMSVVITGKLELYKSRTELQNEIEKLGAKVSSSVSKSTAYLINNDLNSGSSKNLKAKEFGVMIISEKDFADKFLGFNTNSKP